MDQDVDENVAINLSTSQRPSAATTPNEGVQSEDLEQVSAFKHINHKINKIYKNVKNKRTSKLNK